jgi:hypothetical protein
LDYWRWKAENADVELRSEERVLVLIPQGKLVSEIDLRTFVATRSIASFKWSLVDDVRNASLKDNSGNFVTLTRIIQDLYRPLVGSAADIRYSSA